jgi:hypothetical protein
MQKRREIRQRMLERGWFPVPSDMPRDALLRIPVKWAPNFDDEDRVDCNWTEMWCIALWAKLCASGKGTMKRYALELKRHKQQPRLKRAILITAKISAERNPEADLAITRSIELLDAPWAVTLQLERSSGTLK